MFIGIIGDEKITVILKVNGRLKWRLCERVKAVNSLMQFLPLPVGGVWQQPPALCGAMLLVGAKDRRFLNAALTHQPANLPTACCCYPASWNKNKGVSPFADRNPLYLLLSLLALTCSSALPVIHCPVNCSVSESRCQLWDLTSAS